MRTEFIGYYRKSFFPSQQESYGLDDAHETQNYCMYYSYMSHGLIYLHVNCEFYRAFSV